MTATELARYIDHTMLKADAGPAEFDRLCDEAIRFGFRAVCVNSAWVQYVSRRLSDAGIAVCSVVGFPLGAMKSSAKAFEAKAAVADGAREIDMVLAVGAFKAGDAEYASDDIRWVREAIEPDTILKVIIETAMLSDDEKRAASALAANAGADFVKTCTGFGGGAASPEDIALMKDAAGPNVGVKASGGVRDYDTAMRMIDAGATRIGAVSSVAIMEGAGRCEE